MAKLGIRTFDELIGRADLLDMRQGIEHWKAKGLDFSRVFYQPTMPAEVARCHCEAQDHGLAGALDHQLIAARSAGARDEAAGAARRTGSATPTARSARCCRARSRARYGHDGLAGRHDPRRVRGHRRPELRRVPRARRHVRAAGRDQRLRRQGPVRRAHRRLSRSRRARRSRRTTSSSATR